MEEEKRSIQFINVADIINPKSGKTYRQENTEKQHKYKVDDLVEIIGWDGDDEYGGMRLYTIGCTRDCDGTPLYVLGSKGMELYQKGFGLRENGGLETTDHTKRTKVN